MKLTSIFEIDKFQESQMKEPLTLLEDMKRRAAAEMGIKIAEIIPYVKDKEKSWSEERPAPNPFENPCYNPVKDIYRCDIILLSKPDWDNLGNTLQQIMLDVALGRVRPGQAAKEAMQAIENYCQP